MPETHDRSNGILVAISSIVEEIESERDQHDGVTILGGEPFDQLGGLAGLTAALKKTGFHVVVYTGHHLESLRNLAGCDANETIEAVLSNIDILIDGPFKKGVSTLAGEYRGSINQRIIHNPAKC